jgi:16S rRNA (uracil1498-N3)-methyltransferase
VASLYLAQLDAAVAPGSFVELVGDEARHAAQVARVRAGERIGVGDGRGTIVWGPVASVSPQRVVVEADEVIRTERPAPELWLAQALAKGDRDELAVQAATELGASGVIPWAAERSVARWDAAKAAKGDERWRAIVAEAAKQSIRAWIPEVAPLAATANLAKLPGRVLVLEPTAHAALTSVVLDAERITLVVGPEGGISDRELEVLQTAGATAVGLGPEVLRTSTAGPAALAVLNARLGRW